jgi:hypothetical protein
MILWLASYPRSGNTFFRAVLKHVYGIPSIGIYELDRKVSPMEMARRQRIERVVDVLPENITPLAEMAVSDRVHVVKTHELPQAWLARTTPTAVVSLKT